MIRYFRLAEKSDVNFIMVKFVSFRTVHFIYIKKAYKTYDIHRNNHFFSNSHLLSNSYQNGELFLRMALSRKSFHLSFQSCRTKYLKEFPLTIRTLSTTDIEFKCERSIDWFLLFKRLCWRYRRKSIYCFYRSD